MKVSVIIPTYNAVKRTYDGWMCFEKCISSIENQTMDKEDYEVIFVDDCSSDNTIEYINNRCSNINFNIIQLAENSGGASIPRNRGINSARGKYIFFIDSDDYITEDTLDNTFSYAEECNSDVLIPKVVGVGKGSAKRIYQRGNVKSADIINDNLFSILSVFRLYNRDFLIKNKITFPATFDQYEDFYFNIQAYLKKGRVSILADKDYYFWVKTEQEGLSQKIIDFPHYLNLHKEILLEFKDEKIYKARYICRMLELWGFKSIYKNENDINNTILLNNKHLLLKQFIKEHVLDCISLLPEHQQLFLNEVLNSSRLDVIDLLNAIDLENDESLYIKRKTNSHLSMKDKILNNYNSVNTFGHSRFITKEIYNEDNLIKITGECRGLNPTASSKKLILRSRSNSDVYTISDEEFNFSFDPNIVMDKTKGYWDLYFEYEIDGIVFGTIVPATVKSIKCGDNYELYKNWIGAVSLRFIS